MRRLKDWLTSWWRTLLVVHLRNTLDKAEWDGTVSYPQCCRAMAAAVAEGDCPIVYEPVFRRWEVRHLYHRMLHDWQLESCPWCGNPLASDVGDEWAARVERLGFTDGGHYAEIPGLPDEFRTDRWWRQAGL